MAETLNILALDLGAESGRAVLGQFDGRRLARTEVHRFANTPVRTPEGLHWDILRLWADVQEGVGRAARLCDGNLHGVGLDTWGVDFALLDHQGTLVGNPYHYRDDRTDGILPLAFELVPREEIFAQTGIQFMQINTLMQLLAMALQKSPALQVAGSFLTVPDLLNYWLAGSIGCEFTNATTTQCYDPRRGGWAWPLLDSLGIPTRIFPEIVPPGTVLGGLRPALAAELGVPEALRVIAPACHDTGAAVVAVPATGEGFAWISSGTWSILGAEVPEPVIDADSLRYNFTNEGGVAGTFRLCRNIMGLWLVQECRRTWATRGEAHSYDELTGLAAASRPLMAVLDVDHELFLKPGDMPGRIQEYAARTGQAVPKGKGEIVRCALESIALKYRFQLERLERMLDRRLEPIHIVGGGTRNQLLSQFTADATGRPVLTGPVEATAMGNILMQAMALRHLDSLAEARAVVRESAQILRFEPQQRSGWDEAYGRLQELVAAEQAAEPAG